MSDTDAYIALVTSLPNPERLFRAKQPPISRLRLDSRLNALTPEHRSTLAEIETVMAWGAYGMTDDQVQVRKRARRLLAGLGEGTLRAIVAERMDLRVAVAALRMRRDGSTAPSDGWAESRVARHITVNWSDPLFKLETRLPWIKEVQVLLEKRDPLAVERFLLEVVYRQLQRHGARHLFDFEAVVIYVLKWSIFDRWARSDARAASARFETLAQEALGRFADLDLKGAE